MTYTVATMAAAPDPNEFLEIFNANARPGLESAGGSAIRVSQSVMSGDMTGRLTIAVDFDSISAAFEGSLGAGAAVRPAAREAGIELMSRSLVLTKEERGATDGAFGSLMQVTGDPIDDATWSTNADTYWAAMSSGATGQKFGQMVAAGVRTGLYVAVTWTDDLDALQAASTAMFADPAIQQLIASQNTAPVSRSLFRRIG